MIQVGGTVTYNKQWIPKPTQEYSILEAKLLNKLNVTPSNTKKKFVKGLDTWWMNYNKKFPMTQSLNTIVSQINHHELPEYIDEFEQIIIRREQDLEKIGKTTANKPQTKIHLNYIISLKAAQHLFREFYYLKINQGKRSTKSNPSPSFSPPNPQLLRSPSADPSPPPPPPIIPTTQHDINPWFLHNRNGYTFWINVFTGQEGYAVFNPLTGSHDYHPIT